jgi:hypothetical protein
MDRICAAAEARWSGVLVPERALAADREERAASVHLGSRAQPDSRRPWLDPASCSRAAPRRLGSGRAWPRPPCEVARRQHEPQRPGLRDTEPLATRPPRRRACPGSRRVPPPPPGPARLLLPRARATVRRLATCSRPGSAEECPHNSVERRDRSCRLPSGASCCPGRSRQHVRRLRPPKPRQPPQPDRSRRTTGSSGLLAPQRWLRRSRWPSGPQRPAGCSIASAA